MSDDAKRAVEYTKRLAAEARKQREAHEAKITPMRPRQVVKGERLSTIEILQHLAVAKRAHEAFYPDEPDARIAAALIDEIGIAMSDARKWAKVQRAVDKAAKKKKDNAERDHRPWQIEADKVWVEHPTWSDRRVAARVAEITGGSAERMRKVIRRAK